jgi:hypothetical protein
MRRLPIPLLLLYASIALADDIITKGRIKVQLFAAPAFVSEVSVDAYDKQCVSLDNNLHVATSPNSLEYLLINVESMDACSRFSWEGMMSRR